VTKLCVPLTEPNTEALLAAMHALPRQVDLVEVRLDHMAAYDLARICSSKDRPIIVTNRPTREGGRYDGPEAPRIASLARAAELGADYVDVELDSVAPLGELKGGCRKIVSRHDFEGTPPDLEDILRRILGTGPHVAKVAVTAQDIAQVPPVLALLARHAARVPLIALSMGEPGLTSRILACKLGAFLTFASASAGRESAPGQPPYDQMLGMYRFQQIGRGTAVYGVVADPVAHSMSPAVHNAAFAALNLDAVYLPFHVTDPRSFLDAFQSYDLRGLSVTIPHKEAMLNLMDEVGQDARAIGAVNTVAIRQGRRCGWNTDVRAAVQAIEDAVGRAGLHPMSARTVLLVGAGGAARAIAFGLRGRVARLVIANRTVERGQKLAAEFGLEACGLHQVRGIQPDILVNATSVGMWPHVEESPVPAEALRPGMVVFDSVYNPLETRLLREAQEAGAVTASGLDWFVNQAAAQFELWTGLSAPRDVMRGAVKARLASPA
jgi:3-dehydroquinate dehydratase/shikimate dehydrogenase